MLYNIFYPNYIKEYTFTSIIFAFVITCAAITLCKEALPKDRAYRMIIHGECGIFSPTLMTCLANCRTEMEAV